jgi:uncharacterized protein YodC (DUF2158 family)
MMRAEEDRMTFDVGSVVQLKSGGPFMTVIEASGGGVTCTWFDDDDKLQNVTLPAVALKPYEDEGEDDDD